jgi:hypothetical protein
MGFFDQYLSEDARVNIGPRLPATNLSAPTDVQRLQSMTPPTSPLSLGGTSGTDPKQQIMAILQKYPPGSEGLQAALPEIQAAFPGTTIRPERGEQIFDELMIPGIGGVDVGMNFEGGGTPSWGFHTGSAGGAPPGFQMGTFTGGGQFPLASVMGPGLMQPWTTPFERPSFGSLDDDPAFKFRMQQGMDAIQKSAAAKGTLLTGGTMKDLTGFAQGLASEEYDKLYGRNLGEYQMANQIYNQNQSNQFGRLSSLSSLGQNAAANVGNQASSFAGNAADLITGAGNAQAAGQVGSANAWGGAFGNIGNMGSNLALYYALQNQQPPR